MSETVSIPVSFPTDEDGFITQECPSCTRRFKVVFSDDGSGPLSYCPYCQHHGLGCWWTTEHVEYFQSVVVAEVVAPELRKLERKADSISKEFGRGPLGLSISVQSDVPDQPADPPPEPLGDFEVKRFRCCREDVKVEKERFHYCIICGKKSR